jgi:hypothetical protein
MAVSAAVLTPLVYSDGKWRGESGGEYRLCKELRDDLY